MNRQESRWALEWIEQTGLPAWRGWSVDGARAELDNLRHIQKEDGYQWEGAPDFERVTAEELFKVVKWAIYEASEAENEDNG